MKTSFFDFFNLVLISFQTLEGNCLLPAILSIETGNNISIEVVY